MAKIDSENSANATTTGTRRKAAAYINVGVLNKDKTQSKGLGGVPLYEDNEFHAHILNHIKEHGEESLSLECIINVVSDASEFEL